MGGINGNQTPHNAIIYDRSGPDQCYSIKIDLSVMLNSTKLAWEVNSSDYFSLFCINVSCLVFGGYYICWSVFRLLYSKCFFYLGRLQGGVSMETGQRQRTVPQPKIHPLWTGRRFEVLQQKWCVYFLLCNLSALISRPPLKSVLLTVSC